MIICIITMNVRKSVLKYGACRGLTSKRYQQNNTQLNMLYVTVLYSGNSSEKSNMLFSVCFIKAYTKPSILVREV